MSGYLDPEDRPLAPVAEVVQQNPASAVAGAEAALGARAQGATPAQATRAGVEAGAATGAVTEGAIQANTPSPGNATGMPQPPITHDAFVEAVHRFGDSPSGAMITAGAIAAPQQSGPGQGARQDTEAHVGPLVQEIMQVRGPGRSGSLTQGDWDKYLRTITDSAQRNLSPSDQVQALSVIDRIRTTGLQRFAAVAVASADAGDMEGAARALNGMNNFTPDGYTARFEPTQGGLVMTRQREDGKGEPARVTVPAAQVSRYATAMLDPTWSLNHQLNVARHEEGVRHHRETEAQGRERNAISAADLHERRTARREDRESDAVAAREGIAFDRAETAYDNVRTDPNASQADRDAAKKARDEAHERLRLAQSRASQRGVVASEGIVNRGDAERRAAETTRHTRGRESALTDNERKEVNERIDELRDEAQARGATPERQRSARHTESYLPQTVPLNRSVPVATQMQMLRRGFERASGSSVDDNGVLTDSHFPGVRLQMPRVAGSRPRTSEPTQTAPTDRGR